VFKSSITKFLIASLALLMTALLVAAVILSVQALRNYELAGRIVRLTVTERALFDALVAVRAQVPKSSTALIADEDPQSVIHESQRQAARSIAGALGALRATDIGTPAAQLADRVQSSWHRVEALEPSVHAQASRPRANRSLQEIDGWRDAIHDTTNALNMASAAVGNAVRIDDPLIAEMVQIRRTAWTIRDRYGLQCSLLRFNVDTSHPLDAQQLEIWSGNRAVYMAAWNALEEFLLRPGLSEVVRNNIDIARHRVEYAQNRVDSIVKRFDGSGKPAIGGAQWTALCDGPFESILNIAQVAEDQISLQAGALRWNSFCMLVIAGVGLTCVIAFGVFAVINVQRRLARPMKNLIDTIARLSRRDFDGAVAATGSPDELGSMARALETLRASELEAERLQLAMSRFTADASHQMRTPLTVLRTHISVLGGILAPEHEAYSSLQDIQEAADRLQRLLIQLLKLAYADGSQSVNREFSVIDLRELIQEIAGKHAPQAMQAAIDLHLEAESHPFPLRSNPLVITEIISNLIDNAIRYNESGGSVIIRLSESNEKLIVDVEDDGPGIPTAEPEKVFTRFYRMNRDQSRVGSGLGLAIVRSLSASLDATIQMCTGSNDRGLCVRLYFANH
jgi:signal transduction histidine kinase